MSAGRARIVIACVHPTFASATRSSPGERALGLADQRTNRTPRHHGRHENSQEPQRILNECHELEYHHATRQWPDAAAREGGEAICAIRAGLTAGLWDTARSTSSARTKGEPSHFAQHLDRRRNAPSPCPEPNTYRTESSPAVCWPSMGRPTARCVKRVKGRRSFPGRPGGPEPEHSSS